MRVFGLIGFPLGHSFSKAYFAEKFKKEGIGNAVYLNFPLPLITKFPELLASEPALEGLNVTIPWKKTVMNFLDEVDEDALKTGAVNVIKITKQDKGKCFLKGYNTDIYGFRESLLPFLNKYIKEALILGTGGSSLAVRFVLESLGIKYISVSRFENEGGYTYSDLPDEVLKKSLLIINTTPLGMYPETEGYPDINYSVLTSRHLLYDLIYNPEITRFMQLGSRQGCRVTGGLEMLKLQAEMSWKIWNS